VSDQKSDKDQLALNRLRKEYRLASLDAETCPADPFEMFKIWLDNAASAGLIEPNAFALASAGPDGQPNVRMILLKEYDQHGLVFYTNYLIQKGKELSANQEAAMLFYWDALERQIRIKGSVSKVARERAERYFATRPRGAQLAAHVSFQSAILQSRTEIDQRLCEIEQSFHGKQVPCPQDWGGYLLKPVRYEFWQGRESRLHDRVCYLVKDGGGWTKERLAP